MRWLGCLLLATTAAAQSAPTVHYLQLPEAFPGCIRDVVLQDFDGDARPDLIVSTGACQEGENGAAVPPRTLRVHLQRPGSPAFAARPDHELRLADNVVAFAVGDVHPHPGAELVLFAPAVAAAAFWRGDAEQPSYARLAAVRFLWQPADPTVAFAARAVRDLDGDGLDDLLVPEPDGYRVALQRRGIDGATSFDDAVLLRLPPATAADRAGGRARLESQGARLELSFRGDGADQDRPLVEVEDRIPAPQVVDWDGDGDLDVCALAGSQLVVWAQDPAGTFPALPSASHALPERERSLVNPPYSAQLRDLDADGRADLVLVSSQAQGDDVSSTVEVFLGGDAAGPFAAGNKATERLRLSGFVDVPTLDDVDGDARPDLAIGSLRTDAIGDLAGGGGGRVAAQLHLFRNAFDAGDGRFQRPVWLVHKVEIEGVGMERRADALARFFCDVDGDGRADLLLRSERDTLRVLRTTERGRRLAVGDVLWQLRVDPDAQVDAVTAHGGHALLVREARQVLYVRLR